MGKRKYLLFLLLLPFPFQFPHLKGLSSTNIYRKVKIASGTLILNELLGEEAISAIREELRDLGLNDPQINVAFQKAVEFIKADKVDSKWWQSLIDEDPLFLLLFPRMLSCVLKTECYLLKKKDFKVKLSIWGNKSLWGIVSYLIELPLRISWLNLDG
jgi:hypothetical protein